MKRSFGGIMRLLALFVTLIASSAFAAEPVPRFEDAPCAINVPDHEKGNTRCGVLVVPENRNGRSERTIRLPIIILESSSATPAPDPILRTLGGPGVGSLRLVRGRRSSPWLKERDLVIFEQRGTRAAQPSLQCPEVDAAYRENALTRPSTKSGNARLAAAASRCRQRLTSEGIDLSAYNSAESAADIEDLRRVLGFEKWNLHGVSYSAKLMLEVMRRYPSGIRSVVLESTLPPSVSYGETATQEAARSLEQLFANCNADVACRKNYGDVRRKFVDVVKRANRHPIPIDVKEENGSSVTVKLDGHDITTWLLDYVLSNEAEAIAAGPKQIDRLYRNDIEPIRSFAAEQKLTGEGFVWGMRYSVWCTEEFPFENRAKAARQPKKSRLLKGYEIMGAMDGICAAWNVPAAPAVANEPVVSDIPTLILGAEYDAYTPPSWGRLAARTLRNGHYFDVPGVGHGPGFYSRCAVRLIDEFLRDPSQRPATGCSTSERLPFAAP